MKRVVAALALALAVPAMAQDGSAPAAPAEPPVETYEVVAGDTLWDISQRFLGSPWLWPRVWSYNPEITNPNWIYPGDVVRFFPPSIEPPSVTEMIAGHMEVPEEQEQTGPEPLVAEQEPAIEVIETPAAELPPSLPRFVGLFVTEKELAESGTLVNAAEDRMLLSTYDTVFLGFPEGARASPGTRYLIYATRGEVIHPVTGERWGYLTQVSGLAAVTSLGEDVARARIVNSFLEVRRGQYVAPLMPGLLEPVVPKPASKAVTGVVLAAESYFGRVVGEHQILFVDKGTRDGLERGNKLHVLMRGDPYTGRTDELPAMPIAELLVVEANETASTCQIVDARREIAPGDPVVALTDLGTALGATRARGGARLAGY